jgi:hypothetical protein
MQTREFSRLIAAGDRQKTSAILLNRAVRNQRIANPWPCGAFRPRGPFSFGIFSFGQAKEKYDSEGEGKY